MLASWPDSSTEEAALRLAREGESWKRIAALDLLARLEPGSAAIRELAGIVRSDGDEAVIRAALAALRYDATLDEPSRAEVLASLSSAVSSPDEETRRRAVLALGEWARDAGGAATLAGHLERDPSATVRRAAAEALASHPSVDLAVARRLAAVVADEREHRDVRQAAWDALARAGSLDSDCHEALRGFRGELDTDAAGPR